MHRHPGRTTAASLVAAVLAGLLAATPAPTSAAVPGTNGKIAYTSWRDGNFDIYTMNVDGTGEERLTDHAAADSQPAWSPDGSRIAFTTQRHGATNAEIYVMSADGSGLTRLTNNTWHDAQPAWSPDGSRIAFTSNTASNVSEIFVVNADGSGLSQLTSNTFYDGYPEWSPDGSQIAFSSLRGDYDVFVMNADGTGETNLTQVPGNNQSPAWSPDGSKVAFVSHRDGNFEVYVMNADGSSQVNVTNSTNDEAFPEWSPDGAKLAFSRYVDSTFSNSEVFVMNADGSAVTKLTSHPSLDYGPAWQPVPSADLAVSLGATPDVGRAGKPVTYLITVQNAGPSNAHGVVVTDTLPAGARFVSAQPSSGSCVTPAPGATGTVTCALGFVPNQADATAQIVVKVVLRKTTVINNATVTSLTPDPYLANNDVTIATQVR